MWEQAKWPCGYRCLLPSLGNRHLTPMAFEVDGKNSLLQVVFYFSMPMTHAHMHTIFFSVVNVIEMHHWTQKTLINFLKMTGRILHKFVLEQQIRESSDFWVKKSIIGKLNTTGKGIWNLCCGAFTREDWMDMDFSHQSVCISHPATTMDIQDASVSPSIFRVTS